MPAFTPTYSGSNSGQEDNDQDFTGSDCDFDEPTGINRFDFDVDGIPTRDEAAIGLPFDNANNDADALQDGVELEFGSDPRLADTDADGRPDRDEWLGTVSFPERVDTEGDGIDDANEVDVHDTDPRSFDTDLDGLDDQTEISGPHGTDPSDRDSDNDGLSDGDEVTLWDTDPNDEDSDGDGFEDGEEIDEGADPNDPDDVPEPQTVVIVGAARFGPRTRRCGPCASLPWSSSSWSVATSPRSTGPRPTSTGEYRFEVDADDFQAEADVRLRLLAEWEGRFTVTNSEVAPADPVTHELIVPVEGPFDPGTFLFPDDFMATSAVPDAQGAFSIHAAGVAGYTWIEEIAGQDIPEVRFSYPAVASDYSVDAAQIRLVRAGIDDDAFDIDVILHELGHHVSATLAFDEHPGGAHRSCDPTPPAGAGRRRVAWGEGVATWMAVMIAAEVPDELVGGFLKAGDDHYDDTPNIRHSLEDACPDYNAGMADEAGVYVFLWDLYDTNIDELRVDAFDNITLDPVFLLDLLSGSAVNEVDQFYALLAGAMPTVNGNPFAPAFDEPACAFEESGPLPWFDWTNYQTPGSGLDPGVPLEVVLSAFPLGFEAADTEVTIHLHDAAGTTELFSVTQPISQLPVVAPPDDDRSYTIPIADWASAVTASPTGLRASMSIDGPVPLRGCVAAIG